MKLLGPASASVAVALYEYPWPIVAEPAGNDRKDARMTPMDAWRARMGGV